MKRKFIYLILGLMGIGGVCNSIFEKEQGKSILLQNIEALASDESDAPSVCYGSGCVGCPVQHIKVKYVITGWRFSD